jgi:SAM-dependent methyltransferase
LLTQLQYRILKWIAPGEPTHMSGAAYATKSKIKTLLGDGIFERLRGRDVLDYGCGEGAEAIEIAQAGARSVLGVDIRPKVLQRAIESAAKAGPPASERCSFESRTRGTWDAVISLDAFEHFAHPEQILGEMFQLLRPGGRVYASFGPTWYHPLGAHMCSVFPWAHLVFSESALMCWRADLRSDGATRFCEAEGGLNQMSIARFERLVRASEFELEDLYCAPIRKLRPLHFRLTREFTTAVVRATLLKPLV